MADCVRHAWVSTLDCPYCRIEKLQKELEATKKLGNEIAQQLEECRKRYTKVVLTGGE